jgi:ribose transport system substrate-binding protein
MPDRSHDRYLVKSLVHAATILQAFQTPGEDLRLRDVVERTGFGKGMCFRLLHTLHHCGFVEKIDEKHYRLMAVIRPRQRFRIGYASQGQDSSFPREVHAGLLRAAERERLELIVVDNRYQPKVALRNAQHLIKEKVDLVIEFQTDEAVAPAIATKYLEAGIPLIAIDIPHPGATYFGANNYQAGLLGGRYLGQYAQTCWNGQVDEVLILELARAGALVGARSKGIVAGLKETIRLGDSVRVVALDGDGQFKASLEKVRRYIRMSKARHVLVGAANDPSALGAVRAFQETGREATCAVVGQNAEPDAREELRSARTPLVASVAYFPERYGAGLVRLALDILSKKAAPPAVFTRHQIITAENVDHFYPNDSLVGVASAPFDAAQSRPAIGAERFAFRDAKQRRAR